MDIEATKTAAVAIVQSAFNGTLDYTAFSSDAIWWMQGTRELPISAFIDMNKKFREAQFAGDGRFEIHGITAEGNRVAIEAECFAPLKKGSTYNGTYHYLICFRDDKVCLVKEYCDTARARDAFFSGN